MTRPGAGDRGTDMGPHALEQSLGAPGEPARKVFARLDCAPRWRERLSELTLPTLIVHGAADPFFPSGTQALAAEIPDARLLVLDDMGSALQDAAADKVATAMLAL